MKTADIGLVMVLNAIMIKFGETKDEMGVAQCEGRTSKWLEETSD